MTRIGIAAVLLACAVGALSPALPAQPNRGVKRQGLKEAAATVAEAVKKLNVKVKVGKFDGPTVGPAAGAVFAAELVAALQAKGVEAYDEKAEAEVTGAVTTKVDANDSTARVAWVQAKLGGKDLAAAEVRYNTDLAHLLGVSGAVDRKGSFPVRNKAIFTLKDAPTAALRKTDGKTVAAPTAESNYAVEVRLWRASEKKAVDSGLAVAGGRPTMVIPPAGIFELRVLNYDESEVAVAAAHDGVDLLAAYPDRVEGRREVTHFLVPGATGGKPGSMQLLQLHPDPTGNQKGKWEWLHAPAGITGVGAVHLSFSPAIKVGKDAAGVVQFPPDALLHCVDMSGQVVQRGTDVPFEFLTIQYQR